MKRAIAGFHLDFENHWVADLECGHGQHMRHDPPWMERPWVLTPEGRKARLGQRLNCVRCDELASEVLDRCLPEIDSCIRSEYEAAGMSGLCVDGRIEAALCSIDAQRIFQRAFKSSIDE